MPITRSKPTIFVSECLKGTRCLYHGGQATFALDVVAKLEQHCRVISACAEELGGLPTPRGPSFARNGKVRMGKCDVTAEFERGRDMVLHLIRDNQPITCAILLAKSPSCSPDFGILGTAIQQSGIPCVAARRGNGWQAELSDILDTPIQKRSQIGFPFIG